MTSNYNVCTVEADATVKPGDDGGIVITRRTTITLTADEVDAIVRLAGDRTKPKIQRFPITTK